MFSLAYKFFFFFLIQAAHFSMLFSLHVRIIILRKLSNFVHYIRSVTYCTPIYINYLSIAVFDQFLREIFKDFFNILSLTHVYFGTKSNQTSFLSSFFVLPPFPPRPVPAVASGIRRGAAGGGVECSARGQASLH